MKHAAALRHVSGLTGFSVSQLARLVTKQERIEARWRSLFEKRCDQVLDELLASAVTEFGEPDWSLVDFGELVMWQSMSVSREGLQSARELPPTPPAARLAKKPPEAKIPRTLPELREMYDRYRKTKRLPPRQKAIADNLRREYLKRIQKAWRQISDPLLRGEIQTKRQVREAMQDALRSTKARAATVATTEATYYYNRARIETYRQSPDVSHFLFVAIRDAATTKWCRTRNGLVYSATDPLFAKECPPCHWNCRSEVLPLTGLTAKQRALIADPTRQRRNNSPEPLPRGWTNR